MGTIKAFLMGVGTAYVVYAITRKGPDGSSILDDVLNNPARYITKVKDYALEQAVDTVKKGVLNELKFYKRYLTDRVS
jgi:hypothetical protein